MSNLARAASVTLRLAIALPVVSGAPVAALERIP